VGSKTSAFFRKLVPSRQEIAQKSAAAVRWADRRVPRFVRTLLGIPLVIGGIFSILPVLGLWMLPAGILLIALDIPRYRTRIMRWAERQEATGGKAPPADDKSDSSHRSSDDDGDDGHDGHNGDEGRRTGMTS